MFPSDLPLTDAITAGAFAGLVAVGATVAIERLGGKAGGLIATLPTTIVPATLGIAAATSDALSLRAALETMPGGMLLNACFLLIWRELPPRLGHGDARSQLALTLSASLSAWFAGAVALVLVLRPLRARPELLSLQAWLLLGATLAFGIWACRDRRPAPRGGNHVGPWVLLSRGLAAALAIFVAVLLAGLGGPLLAGVAAVFPAIFVTTMVSLWLAQGSAVQGGAVGPMMLGSSSVSAFALIAATTVPAFGGALGCLLAWLAAVATITLPSWLWLRQKES